MPVTSLSPSKPPVWAYAIAVLGFAIAAAPGATQIRALAELLGMEGGTTAAITPHAHGLTLLSARLPYPQPLRGHPIALVALDLAEARRADPARVRETLEAALKEAGHRFELPFLLLANGALARDIFPADLASLQLGEPELKAISRRGRGARRRSRGSAA